MTLQLKNKSYFCSIMNNTRFATVIHILTVLATNQNEWVSSDWIAGSININPVIVRKELGLLQPLGWVISKKGKEGGSRLHVPSDKITLGDIYCLVTHSDGLRKKHQKPIPYGRVGKSNNNTLEDRFIETDSLVIASLQKKTLKSFTE